MELTRSKTLRLVKITTASVVIILILAYAIWRSLNYARGPHITIFEPADGALITTNVAQIRGQIDRANNLSLNGKDISIDEQGNFKETIIIFPGVNIVTIVARDQFERTEETKLTLVGK